MVRYLIDTKVFLWMQAEPEKLGSRATDKIANDHHELFLSAASAWEIAIKFRLGRVVLPRPPAEYIPLRMAASRMLHLPIDASHALGVSALDMHHTDPIDRLLVSQAMAEKMSLVTADTTLAEYGIEVLDATK